MEINLDRAKWLEATQVGFKEIVGLNDLEPQLSRPGQDDRVRLTIGQKWVDAKGVFASDNGQKSRFLLKRFPAKATVI